jgi:hypothetical protein
MLSDAHSRQLVDRAVVSPRYLALEARACDGSPLQGVEQLLRCKGTMRPTEVYYQQDVLLLNVRSNPRLLPNNTPRVCWVHARLGPCLQVGQV